MAHILRINNENGNINKDKDCDNMKKPFKLKSQGNNKYFKYIFLFKKYIK